MGVSDMPPCRPADFLCEIIHRALKNGVYSTWAQDNVVQVQHIMLLSKNWAHYVSTGPILP